jgi:hypothetical protein
MGDRLGILGAVNLLYISLSFHFNFRQGRAGVSSSISATDGGRKGRREGRARRGKASFLRHCLRAGEGRKECRQAGALGLSWHPNHSTRTLKPSDRRRAERSPNRSGLPGAGAGGRGSGAMLPLARRVSRESRASLTRHRQAGIASRPFG